MNLYDTVPKEFEMQHLTFRQLQLNCSKPIGSHLNHDFELFKEFHQRNVFCVDKIEKL